MLVKLPFAITPWALPVLVALYRGPEWAQAHGTRYTTPAHLARLPLARVIRWFPERPFIVVEDTGYGPSETARFCRKYCRHLTLSARVIVMRPCMRLPHRARPAPWDARV